MIYGAFVVGELVEVCEAGVEVAAGGGQLGVVVSDRGDAVEMVVAGSWTAEANAGRDVADPMTDFTVDFQITAHPYLGYRKEDRIDLEAEPLSGVFMGSVILRTEDADFSTPARNAGWRDLIEWCLRLDAAVRGIEAGEVVHNISEPDSDETTTLTVDGPALIVTWSRSEAMGRVDATAFVGEAKAFLRRSVNWIEEEYPAAMRNQSEGHAWERLTAYL